MTAVLLGYGSIGRRHAKTLAGLTQDLIIVESNQRTREHAQTDHPSAVVVDGIKGIDARIRHWNRVIAVIATWGPSHSSLFHDLADRGVRHILCEKPMADSIEAARKMVQRAEREGIALAAHHYVRYSRLVKALAGAAEQYDLGDAVAVGASGGAACLVTNGIHWIDFACELFEAKPERVVSTAHADNINPRSPDLGYFGGSGVWSFSRGREAAFSFSNQSSIEFIVRVYYRNAVVEMDADLNLAVRRRDMSAVERFPKVTRTGPASECLFEGQLAHVVPFEERLRGAVLDVLDGSPKICPGLIGAAAVEWCIGALISARQGAALHFPIDPQDPLVQEPWPIS